MIRKKMVKSAKECIKQRRTNSELYGKMQEVIVEMDTDPTVSIVGLIPVSFCMQACPRVIQCCEIDKG